MAATELAIINSALNKVGEDKLTDLNGTDKATKVCVEQYPKIRDYLMACYDWNFAMTRVVLSTPDATNPLFGFARRFPLPSDCVRFVGIYEEGEPQQNYTSSRIVYKQEGRFILTDELTLSIFYVKKVTDTTLFDPVFDEALAWALGADIAYQLSTDKNKANDMTSYLDKVVLPKARMVNAIAQKPQMIITSDWLDSRAFAAPRLGPVQ